MAVSRVVGFVEDIQLEAEARIAALLLRENDLQTTLQNWIRWLRTVVLPQTETMPSVEYTFPTDLGTWTARIVPGRDPSQTTFALQLWLRNGGQTRFMAIFVYRQGRVYNIDVKQLDARFVWWALRLLEEAANGS